MVGGKRIPVHVPHVRVAANAVGKHQGGAPAAVLLVIEPHPVVGPGEWHGGILAPSAPQASPEIQRFRGGFLFPVAATRTETNLGSGPQGTGESACRRAKRSC